MKSCVRALLLIAATLLFSGCAAIDALTPRVFDPIEYGTVVSIVQSSTRTVHLCNDRDNPQYVQFLGEMNTSSMYLLEYTGNKNDSVDVHDPALQIRTLVLQFDAKAKSSSVAYCQFKLSNIQNAARTTARAVGRLGKYNYCEQDLMSLHTELKKAMGASNAMTMPEYQELARDIVRLGQVNISACDSRQRAQMEQAMSFISKAASLLPL